ncbi:hypothetical protein H104_08272 [Trichophyton rubrum CBS 289.86]|nr:hypothetical protein H104_08272 [Trichophyton rubrum CBS 289.86]
MADQEHIPPFMPAVHLPPGPYDPSSPPLASSLIYDPKFPTPRPNPSQYLIKVLSTALCRDELTWPEVISNHRAYQPPIPGYDVCGTILSTPSDDEHTYDGPKFKVGDENELAFKPKNVTSVEAASIPLSAITAWQAFFAHGNLKHIADKCGHLDSEVVRDDCMDENGKEGVKQLHPRSEPVRVLITNASGGVGVQALQLLRSNTLFGDQKFWICGTCSSRNAAFLKDTLHIDEVIDYTVNPDLSEAFKSKGWDPVDFVFDCIGGQSLKQAHSPAVICDNGSIVSVAHPLKKEWGDLGIEKRGLSSRYFIIELNGKQLEKIGTLVEKGEVRGFVDRVFELHRAREAMELVESKRVRGKVILKVN